MCATTFEIPHTTSVASDLKPHKVTIAIIELTGAHSCVTTPTINTNVYLRMHSKNTSPYTLLPGTVQVFVDNNFVAASSMKLANPGESFTVYLGVDPSVVVRPQPRSEKSTTTGLFSRTKMQDVSVSFTVKNTKKIPVRVSLYAPFPQSTDDRVKIVLKDPVLEGNQVVRLNEHHNLVWTLELKSEQESMAKMSYSVEYPANMQLSFQ
eukprot:TRINITY_DN818_c0_g2_i2.p1 TRINITY_DN818_c0_g2~~TRINITY_DN818_c0_g2_i2.p1  ORF type:complete len:208 (+),score=59.81 TRINITY_DN818_c0_g2_i2:3-626(+)